jgi:protein SCO1/2
MPIAAPKSIATGLILAFAAALGVVAALQFSGSRPASLEGGTLLPQPRALPDFSMVDQRGQAFTRRKLEGSWSLVFPGFTYCPDVCPTTLALLKQVQLKLADAGAAPPRVVFLSVDPGRDTPARLQTYVAQFDPQFVAITAPEPQLAEITRSLGIAYAKVPGTTPESYQMDHTAALVVLDPQARIAAYLTPPFAVDTLVADLRRVAKAAR